MPKHVHDYMRDANGDILIKDGDLVRGESTADHIQDIIITEKGEFKNAPLSGVGILGWLLEDEDFNSLQQEVQEQLEQDGLTDIRKIDLNNPPKLKVKAYYQ